ncbi:polysaccharide lyase family 1 protein [Mariniflexile sp. HNIBRBA6329]|uniref:pectate lyase family protein n=1 Tax=Mariniflexile sp. HNIBRBA6329 TaxID=3373088 RepID=UPI0037468340
MNKHFLELIAFISFVFIGNSQQLAFPGAEGFGAYSKGGRGGQVIEVTSLLDDLDGSIEGSLRWAFKKNTSEPTTIVFRVSGIINLKAELRGKFTKGLTLAGQTAPGDGICIRGNKVNLGGSSNLIIRHLRFRIGLHDDGSFVEGGSLGLENANNVIIDHSTFGWSGEENMTMYDNDFTTVQWCIIHEGLYASGHSKGARSYGAQWGGQNATYHHNLLAHNYSRSPRFNGSKHHDKNVKYEYVNNVNYNWGKANSAYGAYVEITDGTYNCNFINNYYKPGPAHPGSEKSFFAQSSHHSIQGDSLIARWYMHGNIMEGDANKALNNDNSLGLDAESYMKVGVSRSQLIAKNAFQMPHNLIIESAEDAYKSVLTKAGAFPRDNIDKRIVHEVKTGTASGKGTSAKYKDKRKDNGYIENPFYGIQKGIIDNPVLAFGSKAYPEYKTYNVPTDTDHDGMPDAWENKNGLDPKNAEDRNNTGKDGYTMLELYLNSIK